MKAIQNINCSNFLKALFITILVSSTFLSDAQTFKFKTREFSNLKHADTLIGTSKPFIIIDTVREGYYPQALNSGVNQINQSDKKIKSAHLFVQAAINHEFEEIVDSSYTYQIDYQFKGYNRFTNVQNYSGSLVISYNPDSTATFQDISIDKYSDIYQITDFSIVNIFEISDTSIAPKVVQFLQDSLQINFTIEATIVTQVYDKSKYLYPLNTVYTAHPDENYLDVVWNTSGTSTSLPFATTPANFELEWTYIDNYPPDTTIDELFANQLAYNFRNNSTRVWLDDNHYRIPIIYERGYLVYRLRMIQPDSVYFRYPLYAPWTITVDSGSLSSLDTAGSSMVYKISDAHLGDSLNWQYTTSFAEGGRYKHVLSYYDGLLKNRQSITRFNTNLDNLIVTENIYDHEGRPSIKILPTPVNSSAFKYQHDVSLNAATSAPYKAADFDILNTDTCLVETTPPALKSNALANIYYSSDNPDQTDFQRLVPDANGYPFVQTVYDPLNDKKVEVQGGAGVQLQIGNNHYTRNEFVGEDQSTLNQLLGVDAGWSSFYKKTVTTDPNGQVSMSVVDYKGRPVTSAMLGSGPDSTTHAIVTNENVPDTTYLEQELLKYQPQQVVDMTKSISRSFYVDFDGNADIKYKYIFHPYQVPGCSYGLTVAAKYFYGISDACGVVNYSASDTVGFSAAIPYQTTVVDSSSTGMYLYKGKQHLYKTLSIEPEDVLAAVDSFIDIHPSCLKTKDYFIRDEFEDREMPCPKETTNLCEEKKRQMMSDLYPVTGKYGNYHYDTTIDGFDTTIAINGIQSIFTRHENGTYRYMDSCHNNRSQTYTNGTYYNWPTFATPEKLMAAFNDSIAMDLLPLHPEYCKLQGCWVDTFKDVLVSLGDGNTAETQDLLYLQDIIAADPLRARIQQAPLNIPSGDVDSVLSTLHNGIQIDSLMLPVVYCNCSDSVLYGKCRSSIFKDEIDSVILINPIVKNAYFEGMLQMYLANREKLKDAMIACALDTCGPCMDTSAGKNANTRIDSLKPPPVFDNTWGADYTNIDTNSSWYQYSTDTTVKNAKDAIRALMNMSSDSLLLFSDSAIALVNQHNLDLCTGRIDSIVARLANCIQGDTALRDSIKASLTNMCANGEVIDGTFSPEQIGRAHV